MRWWTFYKYATWWWTYQPKCAMCIIIIIIYVTQKYYKLKYTTSLENNRYEQADNKTKRLIQFKDRLKSTASLDLLYFHWKVNNCHIAETTDVQQIIAISLSLTTTHDLLRDLEIQLPKNYKQNFVFSREDQNIINFGRRSFARNITNFPMKSYNGLTHRSLFLYFQVYLYSISYIQLLFVIVFTQTGTDRV